MIKKSGIRDFPDSPVVETSPSNAGGAGLIPGWGLGSHMPRGQETKNIKARAIL